MATVLHEDVLRLIFANYSTGDRQDISTLLRLALVSRHFYSLVAPLLYRSLRFEIQSQDQKRNLEVLMTTLTTKTEVIGYIREIHIGGIGPHGELVVDWLKDLLPKLTLLNAFTWQSSEKVILRVVLLIRQLWPACQLFPRHLLIGSLEANELIETIPQMLQELRLFISHHPTRAQEDKKALVHAIKKCPNMRSLEVWELLSWGCVVYGPWTGPQVRLDLSEGDTLPAPAELKIMDPPFPWEDIGYWGEMGGWRNLEKLTLRDTSPLPFFGGCNSTLRSLCLIGGRSIDEAVLESFCAALRGLEKLEMVGEFARIPTDILQKYGEALKQLEVHGYKPRVASDNEMSADCNVPGNVHDMDRWCPNLSHIALDMFRDGASWPYVFLSTLARFPKLMTLTLYVQDMAVSPYLDKTAAKHIFSYLSSRKIGCVLKELNIHRVSTEVYARRSVYPGHTVFACIAKPLTHKLVIQEMKGVRRSLERPLPSAWEHFSTSMEQIKWSHAKYYSGRAD